MEKTTISPRRHPDTDFLRFIAIMLILNSHLDVYYPIPHIGTGGAIGNALFFTLSSFGLLLSEQKHPRNFKDWFTRRIARIYPSVWVVLFVLVPIGLYNNPSNILNILDTLGMFFYPPPWFLRALLIYYLLVFFLIKSFRISTMLIHVGIAFFLYIFFYVFYIDLTVFQIEIPPFSLIFYYLTFIYGVFLAHHNDRIRYAGIHQYGFLFLFLAAIYAHKFHMTRNQFGHLQFIQQLFVLPVIYYALCICRSDGFRNRIFNNPVIRTVIYRISDITLEIYLIHFHVSDLVLSLKMPFPLNAITFLALTILFSHIVKILAEKLLTVLNQTPKIEAPSPESPE